MGSVSCSFVVEFSAKRLRATSCTKATLKLQTISYIYIYMQLQYIQNHSPAGHFCKSKKFQHLPNTKRPLSGPNQNKAKYALLAPCTQAKLFAIALSSLKSPGSLSLSLSFSLSCEISKSKQISGHAVQCPGVLISSEFQIRNPWTRQELDLGCLTRDQGHCDTEAAGVRSHCHNFEPLRWPTKDYMRTA